MADQDPNGAKSKADETWISDEDSASPFEPTAKRTIGRAEGSTGSDEPDSSPPTSSEGYIALTGFGELREGVTVPGYRIIRQIGKGGMGAVFLAEQKRPKRTVALKVIRADRVTEATRRRFEYEAQILARLKHPGIAQIYEVGSFDLGEGPTPYFAMEYISGAQTLTSYAKSKNLDTRTRLELFAQVCDAVQHGHQKGIIHRDLKPANILVDDTGAPRIIDFGVARSADSENVLATMQTNAGQILGTLQYMSPEQCGGAPDTVDVRADVYALGVVLFQLLSGELPYDLSTLGFAEALLVVTQDRAPSLSSVHAHFKGDLAVIAAKSLDKDKEDRYQSASDLAADIRRYLEDRPILARPIGPVGLLVKWMRRNRELSTAIAAAAAVLAITSTVLITRVVVAERKASANLLIANENLAALRDSVGYVNDIFQFQGPDGNTRLQGGRIDVATFLEDANNSITLSPPKRPATEADFRELLGVGYISLRELEKARSQLVRVLEIRQAESPLQPRPLASAMHNLARVHYFSGEYDQAHALYTGAVERRRALAAGGDDAELATSLTHLAATEQRLARYDIAQSLFEESLAMRQRLYGQRHAEIAASLNNLGNLFLAQDRYEDAESYLRRSLEMITALRGSDGIETSHASHNLARCLFHLDRFEEAERHFRGALAIRTTILTPGHFFIASTRQGLARTLLQLGHPEEAEAAARQTLEEFVALRGQDHPEATFSGEILARTLIAQGRFPDALEAIDASIAGTRAVSSGLERQLAERLILRSVCLFETGSPDAAERALLEAVGVVSEGEYAEIRLRLGHDLGSLLLQLYDALGRSEDAAALASRAPNP